MTHNTPDYRGVFLRGLGSITYSQFNGSLNGITETTYSSSDLGSIQGDSMRKVYGQFNDTIVAVIWKYSYGAFDISTDIDYGDYGTSSPSGFGETYRMTFDSSLVVPTDNEIRPVNKAVRYFIKAK